MTSLLSGMVTSLTKDALFTQSGALSGTTSVGVGKGVEVSAVTGRTTSVGVLVAGRVGGGGVVVVVVGTVVGVSVACV